LTESWQHLINSRVTSYAGYANSVIGSIIANPGFIKFFGTTKDPVTGQTALDPLHVSIWSAIYSVSCIAIQLVAPWTADKYGRKFNMWFITLFITGVSSSSRLGNKSNFRTSALNLLLTSPSSSRSLRPIGGFCLLLASSLASLVA
jgi:MFS family permease